MSTVEERAALKIHQTAINEGEKYANEHGRSFIEEVAYGRGFKSGYMKGTVDTTSEIINKAIKWLKENADSLTWYDEMKGESGVVDDFYDKFKQAMEN